MQRSCEYDSQAERQRSYSKLLAVFLLQEHVNTLSAVRNKVGAAVLLLQEHVSSLSAVRDEVGAVVLQLQEHVSNLSAVRDEVGAAVLLLQEHVNTLSAVRNKVGAAVLLLQEHVKDVILNFQLSFYCNDTSAMKKHPRERLSKMVQSMTSPKEVYMNTVAATTWYYKQCRLLVVYVRKRLR